MNTANKTIIISIWLLLVQNVFAQDSLNSALLDAAWENNFDKVKLLVSQGADVNTRSYDNATPLHFAVSNNNIDMVKLLVYKSANINAKDYKQKTPLHLCAEYGLDSIAEFMILSKAKLDLKNNKGKDALYLSVEKGNYLFADMMMFYGADPKTIAYDSSNLVHAAVESSNLDLLILVLERGADPNQTDINDRTPMYYAFLMDDTIMIRTLEEHGGKFNKNGNIKSEITKNAIEYSRMNMIKYLMQDSTLWVDKEINGMYNEAIRQDHKEVINLFKEAGIKRTWAPVFQGLTFESNLFYSFKDHSMGVSSGLREMKSNIFLNIGYTHRLWPKRVQISYHEMELQLWERRGTSYISLSKGFRVVHSRQNSLFFHAGAMEYYTWGKYDGMSMSIDETWSFSPVIGVQYIYSPFTVSAQYTKLDFSNNLPTTYLLIKCGWSIPFKR